MDENEGQQSCQAHLPSCDIHNPTGPSGRLSTGNIQNKLILTQAETLLYAARTGPMKILLKMNPGAHGLEKAVPKNQVH